MSLKEKLQKLLGKNGGDAAPVSPVRVPEEPAPVRAKTESPEERIRKNLEKASKVALEIDIIRSRLPVIMTYAPVENIQEVNTVLEETETALKGAKVATADLGDADKIAVSAVRELESILKEPDRQAEAAEVLEQLKTALQEDWFGSGAENAERLRRILSLILLRENRVVLDQQIAGMREWAGQNAAQLKALMDSPEGNTDRNAEILRLSNQIKKLKLGISGKETLKTELATIQDALTYALKYATKTGTSELIRQEETVAEKEQTEEFVQAAELKQQITGKLIADKINTQMLLERMAEAGIAPPDMNLVQDLIEEFIPAEEIAEPEAEKIEESETDGPIPV